MVLSRERKTDLIIEAAEILRDASADREIRQAIGSSGPGRVSSRRPQEELDFLAALLDGTIVFVNQDPVTGMLQIAPRPK